MRILLILAMFLVNTLVFALEIDEKLTLRFLKVSNSKKTILINRGAEDGVALGDHAKFFITSGVIARGVAEKVSPSRSIWSLYRVVDPDEITDGKVLNLKIASPVKITEDPSKSMKDEPIPQGSDKMSMDNTDADTSKEVDVSPDDQSELDTMGIEVAEKEVAKVSKTKKANPKDKKNSQVVVEETPIVSNDDNSKNWEVWGTMYFNSLSGTNDNGATSTTATTTGSTASATDIAGGIERYFLTSDSFLKDISLTAFFHKRTLESGDSIKVSTDWFEYGGGLNYHFYNPAASTNKFIGFASGNAGIGSTTITETTVLSGVSTEVPVKGTNMFISVGLGAKYIFANGFGFRGLLDYYSSTESYDYGNDVITKRTLAGPRMLFGISYRF